MTRFRRIPVLLLTAAALGAGLSAGCAAKIDSPSSRQKKDPTRMTPGELQQFVSTNAALAGANAGIEMTQLPTAPLPPESPRVSPPGVTPSIGVPQFASQSTGRTTTVTARIPANESRRTVPPAVRIAGVTSDPFEKEEEARFDAKKVAARMIMDKLQQLDPPIVTSVSTYRVWDEYAVQSTAHPVPLTPGEIEALKDSKAGSNRIRYQFDVEISEPQLHQFRPGFFRLSKRDAHLAQKIGVARSIVGLDKIVRCAVSSAHQLPPNRLARDIRKVLGTAGIHFNAELDRALLKRQCAFSLG